MSLQNLLLNHDNIQKDCQTNGKGKLKTMENS